jgi:hypothetical protein
VSEGVPVVCYGDGEEAPCFERVCPRCRRFIKMPEVVRLTLKPSNSPYYDATVNGFEPNATCSRCGSVQPDLVCYKGDLYRADS